MHSRSPLQTWVSTIISAAPDFILAWVCLQTWFHPCKYQPLGVRWAVLLIFQEFIAIHSAGFFAVIKMSDTKRWKKGLFLLGLSAFYTIFAAGMSLSFGSWSLLWTFWGLCLNRMLVTLTGQAPQKRAQDLPIINWAFSTALFLFAVFLTAIASVPSFGITPEVIKSQGFAIGGLWTEEPYRVLAACALYYTGVGFWQLSVGAWMSRQFQT
jgi:hypothetical protein